ncbi:MAG: Uma2 family endonuclease [Sphingorhabdus sp.]
MTGAFAGFGKKGKRRFEIWNGYVIYSAMNAHVQEIDLKPRKLTVADLLVLDDAGAFAGLGKVELLDGKLYEVSPQKNAHAMAKTELGFRLYDQLGKLNVGLTLLIEPTIKIPPHSAPEPDIAIVEKVDAPDYYPAENVKLVVEVSSTTLKIDLRYKKALYAGAGIPEYWIVDVEAKRIHLFWSPEGEDYRESLIVEVGTTVTSQTIGDLSVDTTNIF